MALTLVILEWSSGKIQKWIWNHLPHIGIRTQQKPSLGLKPVWLGLKPSQNPAWNLNPRVWDSNPAKTHSTWFQDLMKLRFLISHHRKNSARDKVIAKKWIYLDIERSILHRQSVCGPSQRVNAATKFGVVSFYRLDSFICYGRIMPTFLGKGWRFPGFGPPPTPWSFNSALELSWHLWVSFHLWTED